MEARAQTPPSSPAAPDDGSGRARARIARWTAVAFVAAFALRLPLANAGLFHHDEVQLARAVERTLSEGRIFPAVNGRYGAVLLGLALEVPHRLAGGERAERSVVLVGIIAGALLIAALLLLSGELSADPLAAALAAAFAGTSTLFLTSSSTAKENVPQLALVVLACWMLARGVRTSRVGWRAGAAALFGFALTVHEGGALLVLPVAILAVALNVARGRRWTAWAGDLALLAVALAAPVGITLWREILRNLRFAGTNNVTFLGLFSPVLPGAVHDTVPAFGAAALVLAAVGLVRAAAARDLAILALAPWLLVFLYFGNVSSYGPRYLLNVLPPVALLAGVGAAAIARRASRPAVRGAIAGVLLAAAAVPGIGRAWPLLTARADHSGPKAMALLVAARTERDALVVCMDDAPFVEYYARRQTVTHPVDDPIATAAFVHQLKERVRGGTRVYLGSYAFTYDDSEQFENLVDAAFVRVPVGQVVNEWYYRPELEDVSFDDVLYRLELR